MNFDDFGFIVRIGAPDFLGRIVEVPSAKEEAEIDNAVKELGGILFNLIDELLSKEKQKKQEEQPKKAEVPKTETKKTEDPNEPIYYKGPELAKMIHINAQILSTYVKNFNLKNKSKAYIVSPGIGNGHIGYCGRKSDWDAFFKFRNQHRRK